jgi:hypothetical protein
LGLGAAQAVAFGVEGTSLGFVRSCFIITRFVDDALNLSQWYAQMKSRETLEVAGGEDVFSKLGQMFRILHEARFFLFTAKAKNILIRRNLPRSHEIIFIDVPYARTLKWWPLARWAQARDLGIVLGSIVPRVTAEAIDSFYRAYLPDPLGLSEKTIRRYVLRKMRAKQNLTPLSRWFHGIKRRLKGKNNPESTARPSRKVTDG